ncbi:MAG: 30S ribosomal protein S20 [Atribacterota bacterium]
MPNTKSAWKNLRKSEKRRLRNKSVKSSAKTYVKRFLELVNSGKTEEARAFLSEVAKKVDMAVSKGVFHKNKAARIKSRLARRLNRTTIHS